MNNQLNKYLYIQICICVNPSTPIPNIDLYLAPACYDTGTPNGTPTPNSEPVRPDTERAVAPAQPNQLVGHAEPDSGMRTRTNQS